MNEQPRQKLRELVARHGRSIVADARRCESLLRDYSSAHRREVSVLVAALEEHAPQDMLAAPADTPRAVLLARMAQRLVDHQALSDAAARWSVNSWALALGLVSEDELKALERREDDKRAQGFTAARTNDDSSARAANAVTGAASVRTGAPESSRAALVVSARGGGDYASITEAVRDAAPGARVLVRPGLYRESVVLDRQLEIVGDGPREEIVVEGEEASCLQMRAERARVAGLTLRASAGGRAAFFAVDITRGALLLEDCDITSDSLSCVAVRGADAAPVVRRCRVHDGADSGFYFFEESSGTVEDCEVFGSANVGVAVTGRARLDIRRSRIHGGANAGLAVWQEASALVESCEIYANRLAGLGVSDGARVEARSCRMSGGDNSGVFVHREGEAVLEDCELFGHAGAEAAVTTRGRLFLNGCRVRHSQDSGVFLRDEGRALLQGCAVGHNAGSGVTVGAGSVLAVLASRINDNERFAVDVAEGATVKVEDSDLTGNALGAWNVADDANVEAERNSD